MKKLLGIILLVAVIFLAHMWMERNLQVLPMGGLDENTATEVSRGENIAINALIQNCDDLAIMFAFWDNDTQNKVKLENAKIIARGQICAPKELGLHKLTIKFGWIKKYTYYYKVIDKSPSEELKK